MKTFFVINPKAGQGKDIEKLKEKIKSASGDAVIYMTEKRGDAKEITQKICDSNEGEKVRIFSCGGDGTFNEVLCGAIKRENVSLGIIPIGTGNDFCKNFGKVSDFFNIEAQLSGKSKKCDAIFYSGKTEAEEYCGYCANMFNIGFDCNVADMAADMKKKPLIAGKTAYIISIFVILIRKKGAELKIEIDGDKVYDGKLLLTSIANGKYCGGGIKSNADAEVSDGFIDINIVRNMSRLKFLSKLPFYANGTIKKLKKIDKILISKKCKEIKITPAGGVMRLCIDGEISNAGETTFKIVPGAFDFIIPR